MNHVPIAFDIIPADRRHWRYVANTFAETAPKHDVTLTREIAFLQALVMCTGNWDTMVATPDGDEILGFGMFHPNRGHVAWVQVKSIYRQRGVGTALLRWPVRDKPAVEGHQVVLTPFLSPQGWAWAKRRGVLAQHAPNIAWGCMDAIGRNAIIDELKGRLE